MAVVTGDRYLEMLVRFVERQAGPLLEGVLTLRLNPAGLRYVQSRLEALRELEALLAGAPVDYLRAYVSDLGDHRALEQLRRILGLLTSLRVASVLRPPARDPTPLSLLPFARLRVLELRGCDLSTSAAHGLLELRGVLERLICHNSTDALRHVFASRIADIKDSPAWTRLTFVSCACNGLDLMDESLQLLPVVETLDLSRNRFAKMDNLRKCMKLKHLDLGFNQLRTIASLSEVSCPIVKLVLRNNALTTLRGIENLKLVQGLDLSYNIISSLSELEVLSSLSHLEDIWFEGNPICCARWYRAHVFSFFPHPEKLKLDDKVINTREYWEMHIILASRQKQPAGYGFYFPAKDHTEDDRIINAKRKKNSRLASIEDDKHRRYICSDGADKESVSCDSDDRNYENAVFDGESEIIGFMDRLEFMKKEQSVLWLQEFKEWMNQTSIYRDDGTKCVGFDTSSTREKHQNHRKAKKNFGESSRYVHEITQVSDGENSSKILDSDMSLSDTCTGGGVIQHSGVNGKLILEEVSIVNDSKIGANDLEPLGVRAEQDSLKVELRGQHYLYHLEAKDSSRYSSTVEEGDLSDGKDLSTSLTAIDKIMGSRPPSIYPGSPPQYRQDILHRRLNLEEEFLQLSAESHSVASSDSDTSCSDVDSSKCCISVSKFNHSLIQESVRQGICDHSGVSPNKVNHHEGTYGEPHVEDNSVCSSDSCGELEPSCGKYSSPNHDNPFSALHILDDAGEHHIDEIEIQNVADVEKRKGKWKLKRRLVSLSDCGMEQELPKANGVLEVVKNDMDSQGKLIYDESIGANSCEDANVICTWNCEVINSPANVVHGSFLKTKPGCLILEPDEDIKHFFEAKIADSMACETCEELIYCDCIFQVGSVAKENEIALLRSSKNMLYILLIEAAPDGRGTISELGCHSLEDTREVVAGLGLQAWRVYIDGGASYILLTRSIEKSKDLLRLLRVCDSVANRSTYSLRSWEQVQIRLLEKHTCGRLKMSIFLYSMLLFWQSNCVGKSWHSRSLFVIEGYMLVCIENLKEFGSATDDIESSSTYYTIDSCCHIQNILEVVIELDDCRCLTLTLDHAASGSISFKDGINWEDQGGEKPTQAHTWKLRWYSEDTLLKFVALIKAIYIGLKTSPLPVKCISS